MQSGVTPEKREGSLCLSQHIPSPIPIPHQSSAPSGPQALPAAPNFSSSETEGFLPHRSDPWKAGINGIILSPPISHTAGTWGRAVNGRCEESIKSPLSITFPMGSSTCWDSGEPLAHPRSHPGTCSPSLPYELSGQMLHKVIDLIPVMQDTS